MLRTVPCPLLRPLILAVGTFITCTNGQEPASRHLITNTDGRPSASFIAEGNKAMAATASPLASAVAIDIMKEGGNAADAAIAASFLVSIVRPQSAGIGGGGFMLIHMKEKGTTEIFDFREVAPAKADRDMYVKDGAIVPGRSLVGHLAAGVPGMVAGLAKVHLVHGSMPWARLLQPAIACAEEGIDVYPELEKRLVRRKNPLSLNKAAKEIFFDGDDPLTAGMRLIQSDLAKTLRQIAAKGSDGFYKGPIADAIVKDMTAHGGLLTEADLSGYRVRQRIPVRGRYRDHEIISMPPPSSGGIHIIQMLNVLEGYDLRATGWKTAETCHRIVETMRQAYADRAAFLGDPDFVTVPTKRLTSTSYATISRDAIPKNKARDSSDIHPGAIAPKESRSTTHLSIVDPQGNVISTTQTINYSFGACVVVPGTGILLNNEMDDFSAKPGIPNVYGLVGGEANAIAPNKRPLSSMSPTLVIKDGIPKLVVGSPGGSRIITSVLQTIINVIDYNLPLYESVAQGRFHHQWLPDEIVVEENALPASTLSTLAEMGHSIAVKTTRMGEVQAIRIHDNGYLTGVSDPRGSGASAGW